MKLNSETGLALVLGAFFATTLLLAMKLPTQSALLPGSVSALGLTLCVSLVLTNVVNRKSDTGTIQCLIDKVDIRKLFVFLLSVFIILLFGFRIGGYFYVFGYLFLIGGVSVSRSLLLAAVIPAFISLVFEIALQTPIYSGLIFCTHSAFSVSC